MKAVVIYSKGKGFVEVPEVPGFVRAYEPDGLSEKEMLSCGLTQRTLSQFIESGWKLLEQFAL